MEGEIPDDVREGIEDFAKSMEEINISLRETIDDTINRLNKMNKSLEDTLEIVEDTHDMIGGLAQAAKQREMRREYGSSRGW